MSASISTGCACNSTPCVCSCACPPPGEGCVSGFCVPRPCFFDGQLITSDDLNAMVTYFRTRDAMFAKLVAGWGVAGGMRLGAPGARTVNFATAAGDDFPAAIFPNPQIFAGTIVRVSAGAGFDDAGRALTLCSDRLVDTAKLAVGVPSTPISFAFNDNVGVSNMPARFLIAEFAESASRPVPQFSTGGPCDPAPTCNFSRRLEDVRLRLVSDLPLLYFIHGCLDPIPLPGLDALLDMLPSGDGSPSIGATLDATSAMSLMPTMSTPAGSPTGGMEIVQDLMDCPASLIVTQIFEYLNQIAVTTCCANPAIALGVVGQVTLADLSTDFATYVSEHLGPAPVYTVVLDGFPYRRLIGNSANNLTALQLLLSALVCSGGS